MRTRLLFTGFLMVLHLAAMSVACLAWSPTFEQQASLVATPVALERIIGAENARNQQISAEAIRTYQLEKVVSSTAFTKAQVAARNATPEFGPMSRCLELDRIIWLPTKRALKASCAKDDASRRLAGAEAHMTFLVAAAARGCFTTSTTPLDLTYAGTNHDFTPLYKALASEALKHCN